MLQYIEISKIEPHPDNPRKDLGDLSELAESIKANGILQNLTVVPLPGNPDDNGKIDGCYRVVIGHRRLAAAKLAGLSEVPCIVTEMNNKEQVATMLLENMQRNDLTVIEQAEGFQMMLDLGESVKGISEKTGFSEQTVKHRIELNKLNKQKFTAAATRGGRIEDFIALEKITNEKLKNKVLESVGTNNFKWNLDSAIEEQEKPKRKKELIKLLSSFAKPKKDAGEDRLSYTDSFFNFKFEGWKKPRDAKTAEYFYEIDNSSASLYKKEPKAKPKKLSQEEKDYNKRAAAIKELSKKAYESRYDFVQNFSDFKGHKQEILDFLMSGLFRYFDINLDDIFKILNIEKPDTEKLSWAEQREAELAPIKELYKNKPERVMLIAAYCGLDKPSQGYSSARSWEHQIGHEPNATLNAIYDGLISLGYEMSDEEEALRDGTHELFNLTEKS